MASPNRPAPRQLIVTASRRITPAMVRVTLGGDGMAGFPPDSQGGYVKLRLDEGSEGIKPTVRTYTIRHQREGEIDIDFAVHGEAHGTPGPAVAWALAARPGTRIAVAGPGPAKPLPPGMDRYLVAGDLTALPAISVNLEALPADARGHVAIEIPSAEDRQEIAHPAGVELHWLVNPEPGTRPDMLAAALRELGWAKGKTYGWAAAEFGAMRALRDYLRGERGLGPDRLYVSSYWKLGADEDGHRAVKQADASA